MEKSVVLITGCSSGLGFSTAVKFIEAGYIVFAGLRTLVKKEQLMKACNHSKSLHVRLLDITSDMQINSVVDEIIFNYKKIDILINNAAAVLLGPADTATPEEVEDLFKINVFGVLKLSQKVIPHMRDKKSGHIITIGSISGVESSAYLGIYSATKFALEAIVANWATTLHRWNIKATIVEPGAMNTNLPNSAKVGSFYKSAKFDPYEKFDNISLQFLKQCLNDYGKNPDEIAQLILDIAKHPNPNLRYQTCEYSKNLVSNHLKDADGNQWVLTHREFVDSWFD